MTLADLHARYGRLMWALHSAWALISGIAVLVLAHNRYGFLRWIVLFLALMWASTLVFSRWTGDGSRGVRLARGIVSYLTRVMYQETLFFLIPFYFYSATVISWNFLYVLVLAIFAVLSCFDVLFDRLLREHRWFAIGFFAFVSFSALQFFLPLFLRTHVDIGQYIAAAVSFAAAFALTGRWADLRDPRRLRNAAAIFAGVLIAVGVFRPLLPPVPLRLTRLTFSGGVDRRTLRQSGAFEREVHVADLPRGRVYAVASVFSPGTIPAQMQMRFLQNGRVVRASRLVELTAQPDGFRFWDAVRIPDGDRLRVEIWTGRQLLGKRDLHIIR